MFTVIFCACAFTTSIQVEQSIAPIAYTTLTETSILIVTPTVTSLVTSTVYALAGITSISVIVTSPYTPVTPTTVTTLEKVVGDYVTEYVSTIFTIDRTYTLVLAETTTTRPSSTSCLTLPTSQVTMTVTETVVSTATTTGTVILVGSAIDTKYDFTYYPQTVTSTQVIPTVSTFQPLFYAAPHSITVTTSTSQLPVKSSSLMVIPTTANFPCTVTFTETSYAIQTVPTPVIQVLTLTLVSSYTLTFTKASTVFTTPPLPILTETVTTSVRLVAKTYTGYISNYVATVTATYTADKTTVTSGVYTSTITPIPNTVGYTTELVTTTWTPVTSVGYIQYYNSYIWGPVPGSVVSTQAVSITSTSTSIAGEMTTTQPVPTSTIQAVRISVYATGSCTATPYTLN